MNLIDIVNRTPIPEPWAEGEKIPWAEDCSWNRTRLLLLRHWEKKAIPGILRVMGCSRSAHTFV